jgi:hypothetical protein
MVIGFGQLKNRYKVVNKLSRLFVLSGLVNYAPMGFGGLESRSMLGWDLSLLSR